MVCDTFMCEGQSTDLLAMSVPAWLSSLMTLQNPTESTEKQRSLTVSRVQGRSKHVKNENAPQQQIHLDTLHLNAGDITTLSHWHVRAGSYPCVNMHDRGHKRKSAVHQEQHEQRRVNSRSQHDESDSSASSIQQEATPNFSITSHTAVVFQARELVKALMHSHSSSLHKAGKLSRCTRNSE